MRILKNMLILFLGLSSLVALLLWMQGFFNSERIEPDLLTHEYPLMLDYPTVRASYRVMEQTADAVGSIQSRSTTQIASKILATVLTVKARPGDSVKKGDLLISLDDRDLRARLQQARNSHEAAVATLEKAKLDRNRFASLLKSQSVTQSAYDEAASTERIAQARVEQALEQIREAEVLLSNAQIYAPANGTVIEKYCDPGDLATPGKPLLTIYDPGNLRLEVAVREQLAGRLQLNQKVTVILDAVHKEMKGTVEEIVPSADSASRSLIVKVAIPREEGIFPGMYGRIQIPLDEVKYLLLPKEAIRSVGQLQMITVKDNDHTHTRAIRTGRNWNGEIEILSGLSEGEEVVLASPRV